ncbi:MAG: NrtA/SsuA/CpmA family ABC transporter substrate-binding protein [Ruminococcus sp.]|nr:NrtA/SsuA/CpmA family ABC transporter substrate-binding protein [Ruminococcus sp.]
MEKKKIIKKITAILLSSALLLGTFTGCAEKNQNANSSNGEITIDVAYFDSFVWGYYIQIAQKYGIWDEVFGDDNVKVNLVGFTTGPEINEAITAGEIDIAINEGDQPFLSGVANGVDLTILATELRQEKTLIIVADEGSDINSAADLKGKNIAVPIGTYVHKSLIGVLQDNDISVDDVELTNISAAGDAIAALNTGDVDAYIGTVFSLYSNIQSNDIKQIADLTGNGAYAYLIGTNDFVKKYPEITQKFVEVIYKATEYTAEHLDETAGIIAEGTGIDEEVIKELYPLLDTELGFTDSDLNALLSTQEFLIENDIIDEEITDLQENHINTTFIENVKGE